MSGTAVLLLRLLLSGDLPVRNGKAAAEAIALLEEIVRRESGGE